MTRSRRGRCAPIARGVLVLAAVLLLPLAATLQAPQQTTAQTATQDSLWAVPANANQQTEIAACADPSSPPSLSGCFGSAASTWLWPFNAAIATDGVNVYFASNSDGALSCPIADLGANCTRIMAGPWPNESSHSVLSLAAADGQIWIGQTNGGIYRCPANLPYVEQDTAPSQCVLLDDAGARAVESLLLANGRLYAGLHSAGFSKEKQGLLWSCPPDTVDACFILDSYGDTWASTLAAGGGYLWAGLENGIIWRCDLNAANACSTWEQAGGAVNSISYDGDGQGTLYAAIHRTNGVIWSCPTADKNACSTMISNVNGVSVAAGAGGVFSSTYDGLQFGTSPFTASIMGSFVPSLLLYLPADGPAGVGGVTVKMSAKSLSKQFEKRCHKPGRTGRATITVTGPHDFAKTMKVGACALVKNGAMQHRVDLLDPGQYTVTAKAGKHTGEASFTIVQDRTKPVNVKLTRGLHH
jgi:hypothetical protein